jgi:hypothetical protein
MASKLSLLIMTTILWKINRQYFAEWRQIIHPGNIGNRSVNYANYKSRVCTDPKPPLAGGIMSGFGSGY